MTRESWLDQMDAALADARILGPYELVLIRQGGNNRVFRLDSPERALLVKKYFRHPEDRRDRLGAEYDFVAYAWRHGVRSVPEPIACHRDADFGIYEFITGRRLLADDVDAWAVDQAAQFSFDINRHRRDADAQVLPPASEACFSVAEHVSCVDRRIQRLRSMNVDTEAGRDAFSFVARRLGPQWSWIRQGIMDRCAAAGQPPDETLDAEDRCLSASDLGFHNALLTDTRALRFIDFEYAGWDDPAKLICDFFCQSQVPVAVRYFDAFAAQVASVASRTDACLARARLLMPAYQVKWCCILLNELLPAGRDRRAFAGHASTDEDHKRSQLAKAIRVLEGIGTR